ncbi:ABC transporter substrate-binding protein [Bdellovibrio svalbardensis]|uniref:Thiamine pyrimidine synthase n=1 Tax=Bdellovibrio svalbardensis TaxID=2972972 RepID=A0ABT6DIJ5_9BACT|nr:ABC transporter substrate-binding protein [Bdellovibrio svalbardensis]MDG0816591.1 ABC transporter substrate-binding protein [Bdellovibrio svalbardensis]
MKNVILVFVLLCSTQIFAAQTVSLALNWKAEPEFGGFYAAELEGYFAQQGLKVDIIQGGSGTPTVQMLANKKVDFAIVSADEIILSQDRNSKNKVKALYAVYQTAPYIVMSHKERGFKNLKEVFTSDGVLSMQSGLPYFQFLVKKFGKPKVKVVPYLGGVANFINDKNFSQQGFLTTEPLSAEKSGAKVQTFMIADEGFNPYLVVLATTEDTLKNKPDLVKKVLKAVDQGWKNYLSAPDKANHYMATLNKSLNLETFKSAAEIQKPLIVVKDVKLGSMMESRWDTLASQLKDLGLIKITPKATDLFETVNY